MKVYHAINPTYTEELQTWPKDYELVAEITSYNEIYCFEDDVFLNYAYRMTNHITAPWWTNKNVKCIKQTRSTSLGDIIEIKKAGCREYWMVKGTGWKHLGEMHETSRTKE